MRNNIHNEQFKLKNSNFRKKLALYLKLWREYHSIAKISKLLNINTHILSKSLSYSKAYSNRKHRRYGDRMRRGIEKERNKNVKGSNYRNKIALCLKIWKKLRSIKNTAKTLSVKIFLISELLNQSKRYKNRQKYTLSEKGYAKIWAFKLKAVKMLGGKCEKCGSNNIMILELHHRDKNTKEICFSDIVRKGMEGDREFLYGEIRKCILLCRNCHQEIHNDKIPKNLKNKKYILEIINNNGKCDKCGYDKNISCLEFHHKDPKDKKFSVSALTDPRRNYDKTKLKKEKLKYYFDEVKKCSVLCCNCHQIEHINSEKFHKLNLLIQIMERLIDGTATRL